MITHKITLETELEFLLIGISCAVKDFRLCWGLNNELDLKLVKKEDYFLHTGKRKAMTGSLFADAEEKPSSVSHYTFQDEDNFCTYHVLSNYGTGELLIPEHKKLNFFLVLIGSISLSEKKDLLKKMTDCSVITAVQEIDTQRLASKKNLLDLFSE